MADGPKVEAPRSIVPSEVTPPTVAKTTKILAKAAKETGASSTEALEAAMKVASQFHSGGAPAEKED